MVHQVHENDKPLMGQKGKTMEKLTISIEEAGRILGLSRNSAYAAAARGELPILKFGRRLVVPQAALQRLLDAAEPKAQAEDGR